MGIFYARRHSSVGVAKKRLVTLLSADRSGCTPREASMMESDLYDTLAKYLTITPDNFQVTFTDEDIHIRLTGEKY